jgi:hypothetical protein
MLIPRQPDPMIVPAAVNIQRMIAAQTKGLFKRHFEHR